MFPLPMLPLPGVPAFLTGMPGIPELLIIAVIVLLLFGKRLPGAMRSVGASIVEFKRGLKDVDEHSPDADERIDSSADRT